jgi:hypothetical protein
MMPTFFFELGGHFDIAQDMLFVVRVNSRPKPLRGIQFRLDSEMSR